MELHRHWGIPSPRCSRTVNALPSHTWYIRHRITRATNAITRAGIRHDFILIYWILDPISSTSSPRGHWSPQLPSSLRVQASKVWQATTSDRVHARASDHFIWAGGRAVDNGHAAIDGGGADMVFEGRVNNRRRTKLYLISRFERHHVEFRWKNQNFTNTLS